MDKPNVIEYSVFGRYALFTDPLQLSDTDLSGAKGDNGIHLLETHHNLDY